MKKEHNISSAKLIKTILIFSLIILSLSFVYAAGSAFEPTAPSATQTTPTQAGSAFEPTTATGAPSANPLTKVWTSIKDYTNQATNWVYKKSFGEEIPSISEERWWTEGQWNNPAWWSSAFCSADTRADQGWVSGSWNWIMVFVGARSASCYDFWIKQGIIALLTSFWAVLLARLYVLNFVKRNVFGAIEKGEVGRLLLFLSSQDMEGLDKHTGNMEDQAEVSKKHKMWLLVVAALYVIALSTGMISSSGPMGTIITVLFVLIIIAMIALPRIRKAWGIPIFITTIVIWVIMKIMVIKFVLWPLMLTSSYIIGPIATALWIVWYPIWQVEKEKRRLQELERAANNAEIKAKLTARVMEGIAEGFGKGLGGGR